MDSSGDFRDGQSKVSVDEFVSAMRGIGGQ